MRAAGKNRWMLSAFGPAALLAAACWGDVVPVWPDGPMDTDTGTGTGDAPEAIPGGGLGGGPLDGRLDLFVLDEESGGLVAGARALLVIGASTLTAETGADGHAVFEDDGLAGSVEIHILADGFVAETFLAVDTAEATLLLRPASPAPAPAAAILSGTVGGWEELPEPTATQRRALLVAFGPRWADLAEAREPLLGASVPKVVVEIEDGDPAFELEVPPVPGALHVFSGLVETFGTADTADDAYDWRFFAALPGLDPQPGETLSGLDLEAEAGLPVTFHAGLSAFPSAYERADVELVFDLGDPGTVWVPGTRQGGKWVFAVPDQAGALAVSVPFVIARGDQTMTLEEGADEQAATPLGRYVARDLGNLVDYTTTSPFLVPGMPSPPAQVGFDGDVFHCLPMAGTDLAHVSIAEATGGAELWRVTAFGSLPDTAALPPFPGEWGFTGVPDEALIVRAWTAAFPGNPGELHFASYPALVRELAFEAVEVE